MEEELINDNGESNDLSPVESYECSSICPVCSLIHNNCVLDGKHEEKHMCANGHFWM